MKLTPLDPWIKQKTNTSSLKEWQLAKLNETLALVRAKSPFYRDHFAGLPEALSALDQLRQFPFTTPEHIRHNPLRFLCVSQDEIQRVVTLQSSGTTGEPKRIFFTAGDQALTVDFFGVGMSTLVEAGERVLILLPGEKPGSVGDLLRIGLERIGGHPIPYGMVKDPLHALKVLQDEQPDCLVGTPTQVLGLARRWNGRGKAPRSALLTTDYVPAAIVKFLGDMWGCKVFNHYGATEMGLGGGVECEALGGYHMREADLYFEIIQPETGEPVPEGEFGEVVFSTLTRRGMPLLRYRMGDRSRFIVGECPCGAKLRRMEKVTGRFGGFVRVGEESLKLPDIDETLFPIPGLLNYSVAVTGKKGTESLNVEAYMLTDADSSASVKQALGTLSSIKKIQVDVRCVYNPGEAGSMVKRVILDQRG